jgi:hypothetical protein
MMMKTMAAVLAGLYLLGTAGAAQAAGLGQRASNLERRIGQGVIDGSLTRAESSRLQRRLWRIERIEHRYRRHGLTEWERQDLRRRYNGLSVQVNRQRHDRQHRRW